VNLKRSVKNRLFLVVLVVMIISALGVSVALANHISPVSLDASASGCSIKYTAEWGAGSDETSVEGHVVGYVNGVKRGEKWFDLPDWPTPYSTWNGRIWIGHSEWDSVEFYINSARVHLDRNCTTGEPQDWWFSVQDLGSTSQYVSDGSQACGVFDVQGWGAKTVDLTSYPNCTGEVSVVCLDGEGAWTDTNVHNFSQEGSVVQWFSSQEGTCAFFEK